MNKLTKYNSFLNEREFQYIIDDIFKLVESEGKWTGDDTYEWNINQNIKNNSVKDKLKKFLSKLPKEEIKKYFYKLVDKLKLLPKKSRKKLIVNYAAVFLTLIPLNYIISPDSKSEIVIEINDILQRESRRLSRTSDFKEAQGIVKQIEAGYSGDRGDRGNWIKVKGKRTFIGTNHGISAQILAEYLGKSPTKKEMKNLSYETALKIYEKNYWDAQNLSKFCDQSIANILYDGSVNQGKTGMKDVLRRALVENGVKITEEDNPFNTEWIKKANKLDQESLFKSVKSFREDRYKEARTFKRHGEGWLNRLNSFEYENDDLT